jgi:two-component system, NarL family, nitrate/nitrite response regulator NarL
VAAPRVLVVGGDALARSGVVALLAGVDARVAGQAAPSDGPAAAASAAAEVALYDLATGDPSHLAELAGALPVVALVADEAQAGEALSAGARGIVFRTAAPDRVAAALAAAHRGLLTLEGALAAWVRAPASVAAGATGPDALTPRESEVLALLAEGLPNKAIAQRLGIGERTAKFHVEAILAKLGAESRSEAIVLAARRGLVTL